MLATLNEDLLTDTAKGRGGWEARTVEQEDYIFETDNRCNCLSLGA